MKYIMITTLKGNDLYLPIGSFMLIELNLHDKIINKDTKYFIKEIHSKQETEISKQEYEKKYHEISNYCYNMAPPPKKEPTELW